MDNAHLTMGVMPIPYKYYRIPAKVLYSSKSIEKAAKVLKSS